MKASWHRLLRKKFFSKFKLFSVDNVLKLSNGDNSDFSGSESNGEEGEEVYTYRGPGFSVPILGGTEAVRDT